LWSGDAWSSDNSQQLLGSFTFTHVLHGFVFCGLLALVLPRLSALWRLWAAVSIEAFWEVAENSELVIRRYREWTVAHGYNGDTIVNSFGDILACGLGFVLARQPRVPPRAGGVRANGGGVGRLDQGQPPAERPHAALPDRRDQRMAGGGPLAKGKAFTPLLS
jgi:hypothetical protein